MNGTFVSLEAFRDFASGWTGSWSVRTGGRLTTPITTKTGEAGRAASMSFDRM